jgi:predicted RNA-binding protein with PUA-like domain
MKSEPESTAGTILSREGDGWDGVRNYRARNNLRAMQVGDEAFFYHSVTGKEIVGIMQISVTGIGDPTDEGKWAAVKVKPVREARAARDLAEIKASRGWPGSS